MTASRNKMRELCTEGQVWITRRSMCFLTKEAENYFCFVNISTRVILAHIAGLTNTDWKLKSWGKIPYEIETPSSVNFPVSYTRIQHRGQAA